VVWENDSGVLGIWFSRSVDGGLTFSAPAMVSTNTSGSISPQMAVGSTGNLYLAWEDDFASGSDISFNRSLDRVRLSWYHQSLPRRRKFHWRPAQWSTPLATSTLFGQTVVRQFRYLLHAFGATAASISRRPRIYRRPWGFSSSALIATDSAGNISVIWTDNTPPANATDIFYTRSSNGGASFSAPINISNNSGFRPIPWLAVGSLGNVNVVWDDTALGNEEILFSRSD